MVFPFLLFVEIESSLTPWFNKYLQVETIFRGKRGVVYLFFLIYPPYKLKMEYLKRNETKLEIRKRS